MNADITVILTLFRTPEKNIRRLNQYKNYKLIIFNQASNLNDKKSAQRNHSCGRSRLKTVSVNSWRF